MPKPVYALVGADPFLQLQKQREILAELPADAQRVDLDGERAELSEVLDELRSFAMFGGGKVVVVRSADAFLTRFREQLEDYVAAPCDSATLIMRFESLPSNQRIYKAIAKSGQIEPCTPPKDLARWVVQHAKTAHGATIAPDAASLLVELVGDDLGRLDTELAKLALSSDNGKIDAEGVSGGVAFQRERQMWDMTNELACGRTAEAMKKWRQLIQLDTSAEFRAVTWLGMWLENVRKAIAMKRKGLQPFAIAQQLRIWPREIQGPFFQTADALGESGATRATDLLADVDLRSKSGLGDAASNVERFILQIGAMQHKPAR
ncbi:MAG TPA: DNA polymerase III subunit delta [Tepidisphaeraceae bacterium]|nr:DNA polymerase III subunit delta [Tepidisphaeraceae bacterium]